MTSEPRLRRDRPVPQRPSKAVLLRRLETAARHVQEAREALGGTLAGNFSASEATYHLENLRVMVEALPDGKRRD